MLKKILMSLCIGMACFSGIVNAQDGGPNMGIIPAPVSVKKGDGQFVLSQETVILADSINNKAVLFLKGFLLNEAKLHVKLKPNSGAVSNSIVMTSKGADALPAQGYSLIITPTKITIVGKGAGL